MLWHALVVKPQHEKTVHGYLRSAGRESFLPLYRTRHRWSDRIKELELPLFAGYVFCRFDCPHKADLLKLPGVRSVVGFGNILAEIPEAELDAVRALLRSGLPVRPWPHLEPGDPVRLESGPLRGVEGVLLKFKNAWQVVVNVELLNRSVIAEVDLTTVFPSETCGHRRAGTNSFSQTRTSTDSSGKACSDHSAVVHSSLAGSAGVLRPSPLIR
jgi:transcription antitermination factor NusG